MPQLEDQTPYGAVLEDIRTGARGGEERLVSLFERPRQSVLSRDMVALLSTGKYRTLWRGAPLMKDAISWVIVASMLQEIRPRTIFDLGTCGGGAALWLADLCRALDLDTTIVTLDIEDLRTEEARRRMDEDPRIRFQLGDLTRPGEALPPALLASLPHPWIVLEGAHVPPLPLLTHLHLHGLVDGDYLLFEDTHVDGPNTSGMGAHDLEGYKTGFGAEKMRALTLALSVFSLEYQVDTRYADMFGLNAALMSNSVFRRVEPEETAQILEFDAWEDLSAEDVQRRVAEAGHLLLRPTRPMADLPYDLIPALLGIQAHDLYEQGSEHRDTAEDARYLEVTRFPADQWIPPHNEMYYTPTPPSWLAFLCLTPPASGGETSLYDGERAWQLLPEALRARLSETQIRWRRLLGPPSQTFGLANTSWRRILGATTLEEAQRLAVLKGYEIVAVDDAAQTLLLECRTGATGEACLATSAVGNHTLTYDLFFGQAYSSIEVPRWEDGAALTEEEVLGMLEAFVRARIHARWTRRGEVLLLDNRRFAHGRQPCASAAREIVVVMGS